MNGNDPFFLSLIAGDDCGLRVDFVNEDGSPYEFAEGDRAELYIDAPVPVAVAGEIDAEGSFAEFYLSCALTAALVPADAEAAYLTYCVHLFPAGGGRNTPIAAAPLEIVRCHSHDD